MTDGLVSDRGLSVKATAERNGYATIASRVEGEWVISETASLTVLIPPITIMEQPMDQIQRELRRSMKIPLRGSV